MERKDKHIYSTPEMEVIAIQTGGIMQPSQPTEPIIKDPEEEI